MHRITLVCVFLSCASFSAVGVADENTDRLTPPLTPIYVAPSPMTSSTTYYPPASAASASPLTVAASTPPRWESVANYVSGALDNLAETTSGAVEVVSPAAAEYTTDAVESPAAASTNSPLIESRAAASSSSPLIESPAAAAYTPGISVIPGTTEYGSKTTVYRPAAPSCSTCTKVYTPATTVYNPVPVVTAPAAAGCCPPASSACCPPPSSAFARRVVACRPVVETASMPRNYYVGKGMIGQPVVYVPNQPVRNALRWFFP